MAFKKINGEFIPIKKEEKKLWKDFPVRDFETIFFAKRMPKSEDDERRLYISDSKLEKEMKSLWCKNINSLSCLIGYSQTGKTAYLRHCFGSELIKTTKNGIVFFTDYVNAFYVEENMDNFVLNRLNMIYSSLLCKFPKLNEYIESTEGKGNYRKFINVFSLEGVSNNFGGQVQKNVLMRKLFFLLCIPNTPIRQLIFCIDGIDHIKNNYKKEKIIKFYSFLYSYFTSVPPKGNCLRSSVHMLFSVSPYCYSLLCRCIYEVCDEYIHIFLKNDINLEKYLNKRIKFVYKGQETETWRNCQQQFGRISQKFGGKYDRMIKNLCFNNVGKCMELYARVLTNRRWVLPNLSKNASAFCKEDYVLNNITVIRSIVCGENEMFVNDEEGCITNLLYNTDETLGKNYSILCLYIVCMFKRKENKKRESKYGFTKKQIIKIFEELFLGIDGMSKDLEEVENYLLKNHVLGKESDVSCDNESLYLTLKGIELWNMLQSDSVLFEMCREDYYRQYDKEGCDNNPYSSYHLMQTMQQHELFIDLCRILEELVELENEYVEGVRRNERSRLFEDIFGEHSMSYYLSVGLNKSMEYSGLINHPDVKKAYLDVIRKIAKMESIIIK